MATRALFTVNDVLTRHDADNNPTGQIVKLNPSYVSNPENPNHAFWKATPTGSLEMQINNPAVFGFFKPGQSFWLDFTPVEPTS
jgi:hypothetical protein